MKRNEERVSDEALVARAQLGDQQAREELMFRYWDLVRKLARGFFLADGETVDLEERDGGWLLRECKLGAGRFVLMPTPDGFHAEVVNATGAPFVELLQIALRRLFPEPLVQFATPQPLDVTVARAPDGRFTVHLVNVSGPHAQAGIIDKIDPIVNIATTLRLPNRPQRLRLEPSGVDLSFDWADGVAKFTLPSVPLHEIIVVD